MPAEPRFRLRKWYLDCVTADGEAVIGYWAQLRWGAVDLRYGALLQARPGEPARQRHTLRPGPAPRLAPARCAWRCAAFDLGGEWQGQAAPVRRVLLRTAAGAVRWQCELPVARVRVRFRMSDRAQFRYEGYGYVERLELTIPPWQLPLRQLVWGRFTAPERSMVWLQWRGAAHRRLVLLDGRRQRVEALDATGIRTSAARLRLLDSRPLRSGALATTALRAVPRLIGLLPDGFRGAVESKQLSRAVLSEPGHDAVSGWAIHEVVQW